MFINNNICFHWSHCVRLVGPIIQSAIIQNIKKKKFHSIQHCAHLSRKWEQKVEGFWISLLGTGLNFKNRCTEELIQKMCKKKSFFHQKWIFMNKRIIFFNQSRVGSVYFERDIFDEIIIILNATNSTMPKIFKISTIPKSVLFSSYHRFRYHMLIRQF